MMTFSTPAPLNRARLFGNFVSPVALEFFAPFGLSCACD